MVRSAVGAFGAIVINGPGQNLLRYWAATEKWNAGVLWLLWCRPVRDVSRKIFAGFTHSTKAILIIKKLTINRIY
jgi:hypothetical protein